MILEQLIATAIAAGVVYTSLIIYFYCDEKEKDRKLFKELAEAGLLR